MFALFSMGRRATIRGVMTRLPFVLLPLPPPSFSFAPLSSVFIPAEAAVVFRTCSVASVFTLSDMTDDAVLLPLFFFFFLL